MDFASRHLLSECDPGNLLYEDKAPIDPKDMLPREKRAPKAKELTRWERFAQMKGIKKRKRSKRVWDEASQSWKPRWGKGRVDSVKDKWVLEVPDNADPYEDQFEKLSRARSERRAKNEFAKLKNIARTVRKGQAPPVGILTESEASKNAFSRALEITKRSDASMGRFSQEINEQKIAKKAEYAHLSCGFTIFVNFFVNIFRKKCSMKNRSKKRKKSCPSRHAKGGKGRGRLSNKK
ncbi:unnamed protein product [Hydatigera taeniaeformis]|uniref:Ribosome biogenesis regulatory protein n=1 Tax=Hydatigena taeniaeformis TaxID=6205 RepID=A0A0R3X2P6_HYDTA|nr:unnamed protein product [Hydatigera taeniaeformis]